MKVLVVGGLGFIGSHLTELLLQKGLDITILDNKSTNVVDEAFFPCTVHVESIKDFTFIEFYDVVFHLASVVGPSGILKHAGNIASNIIDDTTKIMKYCMASGALMVDVSTSEVYGHSGRLSEGVKKVCKGPYSVRMEYGASKLAAEIMVANMAKISGLKYHIIRPFNVSGPRQKPDGGFVLPRFVVAGLTKQPLTIFGDGQQIRSVSHVKDIVDGIYRIATSNYKNHIWNVGNPDNLMTIIKLAEKVIEKTGGSYIYVNPKDIYGELFAEVGDKLPYVEKLHKLIDWRPEIDIQQVIDDTVEFYREKVSEGYYFKML